MRLDFYLPASGIKKSVANVPRDFRHAPALKRTPVTPASFLAALCDAGYGSALTLFGSTADPRYSALHDFLLIRAHMLHRVVEFDSAGEIRKAPFAEVLDSTDTSTLSYLLGTACARLSLDPWVARKKNWKLLHFWHRSVYGVKGATVVRAFPASGKHNANKDADFLICLQYKNGPRVQWHAMEAKGTFSSEDWRAIKRGFKQAANLAYVTTPTGTSPLAECLVSQGWFENDATALAQILRTTLLDPLPAESGAAVQVVPALAELRAFATSSVQFSLFGSGEVAAAGPFLARRTPYGSVLAISEVMERRAELLRAISALELLIPLVQRLSSVVPNVSSDLFWDLLSQVATAQLRSDDPVTEHAAALIRSAERVMLDNSPGVPAWMRAVSALTKASADESPSAEELLHELRHARSRASRKVAPASEKRLRQLEVWTTNGALAFSGRPPDESLRDFEHAKS